MKHYVLLKLAPGADAEKVEEKLFKTYDKLDEELNWLNKPAIYRCCANTGSNADIMAVINIDGEEHLQEYLSHPLQLKLEKSIGDAVASIITFDHY